MRNSIGKYKHIINVICGLIVMCLVCTGAVYDVAGIDVTITEIDEIHNVENSVNIRTRQCMVDQVVSEQSLQVGLFDKVNLDGTHTLNSGDEIIIRRGVCVCIELDGEIMLTSTTSADVQGTLIENGIMLNEEDYTIPSLDSPVTTDMKISVIRKTSSIETREEVIPYEVIYKDDSSMPKGTEKVITKGIDGRELVTESVIVENGAEVERKELSREVLTKKVDKVVKKGTKVAPVSKASTVSNKGFSYTKKLSMVSTAYSAFNKKGGYGITASGMTARYGIVAVDPKVIPLGTQLYVEGYGFAVAGDTGGVIKGNKIDLCFEKSNKELMAYGRKTIDVYILQ